MTNKSPLVTVVVPSYNQGRFLEKALSSILEQNVPVEIFVMDAASTDETLDVIQKWQSQLSGWRSHPDNGQSAAINEGIARGKAPYVCWLNSDDWLLPGSLSQLIQVLETNPECPAAYGRAWNFSEENKTKNPIWVESFDIKRLALRCFICQPATLIRRTAWESIEGLNDKLHMAMDYDLWWRLYVSFGPLHFLDAFVAVNREHGETKTNTKRRQHYQEAIKIVRQHYGHVPLKWYLYQPYSVWYKTLKNYITQLKKG